MVEKRTAVFTSLNAQSVGKYWLKIVGTNDFIKNDVAQDAAQTFATI